MLSAIKPRNLRFFSSLFTSFVTSLVQTNPVADDLIKIYTHPFNKELFSGELKPEIFGHYLHDDYLYLHYYAKILHRLSAKTAPINPVLAHNLHHLGTNIISGEQNMQIKYRGYFTYTAKSKPGKAIQEYLRFLETTSTTASLPVALSSVLPCFWVYYQIGVRLHPAQRLSENPYKEWIATYSSPDFIKTTLKLEQEINKLAQQVTAEERSKMQEAFVRAVHFELSFFDEVHAVVHEPQTAFVTR